MRRQFLMATVAAIAIAGPAFAADLPMRAPPPPPYVPPYSWTGLYVGAQVGYAWANDNNDGLFFAPAVIVDGVVVAPATFLGGSFNNNPSGVIGGGHIGYNLQIGSWVAGLEGTVDGTSLDQTSTGPIGTLAVETRTPVQGSIRLRAGYAWDRLLIYATGGAAFAGIHNTYTDQTGFFTGLAGASEEVSKTRSGWTVGGGIAYALTNNWSVRVEYRYSDFGHYTDYPLTSFVQPVPIAFGGGILAVRHHLTENQVQAGLTYKFDTFTPAPVVAKY